MSGQLPVRRRMVTEGACLKAILPLIILALVPFLMSLVSVCLCPRVNCCHCVNGLREAEFTPINLCQCHILVFSISLSLVKDLRF